MAYSYQGDWEKTGKAMLRDANVSWKDCNEVCYAIRNKNVDKALKYLDRVLKKQDFIPYRRYHKKKPHRKGGTPGGWPIKAVKLVKSVLENAKANAENKGLDANKLKIVHSTAYKTITLERTKPKGKAIAHNIDLATIEIVVKEV
ncbi:50S ribosomal protein L22 [Candidatus Micrarchaeota archaeon]|nr:MAG: 50S ribosomal protein L22 [Candidatus Micrarchaeota archaeon]